MYDQAFKSAVCFEIVSGNLSYSEAKSAYGIRGPSTIARWVKQYQNLDVSSNLHPMNTTDSKTGSVTDNGEAGKSEDLSKRNNELEAALKMAKLKITALETMIDIAESDLNIDIRKKSGTKQ